MKFYRAIHNLRFVFSQAIKKRRLFGRLVSSLLIPKNPTHIQVRLALEAIKALFESVTVSPCPKYDRDEPAPKIAPSFSVYENRFIKFG
ncbi:hypothetical protein ACPV5S_20080 [Vibrio astriarenae]